MGSSIRKKEIRRRRERRAKRARQRLRELRQALTRGKTHDDRVRIAGELRAKQGAPAG